MDNSFTEILSLFMLSHVWLFATPWIAPTRLLCPWNFPGKNTRVGRHSLLQGIYPTQGSNLHFLCLLHWQADSLPTLSPVMGWQLVHWNPYLIADFHGQWWKIDKLSWKNLEIMSSFFPQPIIVTYIHSFNIQYKPIKNFLFTRLFSKCSFNPYNCLLW